MKTFSLGLNAVIRLVIFDILAISFIFLLPSFSHLVGIPLYIFDPMRFALFLAILITNKKNSYAIALLLPLVSFLISSHPYFYKVFLISGELLLNVWLFYFFVEKFKNVFLSSLTSIIVSKTIYYLFKFAFISFLLINDTLVSTSIIIQVVVSLALSIVMAILFRKEYSNR